MNTIRIAEYGTDLSSRSTGHTLRDEALRLAATGPVLLDFDGVRSVSHSFADESLAVLVESYGEQWFREHIRVVNHSPIVRWSVLDAIHHRISGPLEAA